jgi:hypothetical protein
MRALLPFLLLVVVHHQALADFPTAEAAVMQPKTGSLWGRRWNSAL